MYEPFTAAATSSLRSLSLTKSMSVMNRETISSGYLSCNRVLRSSAALIRRDWYIASALFFTGPTSSSFSCRVSRDTSSRVNSARSLLSCSLYPLFLKLATNASKSPRNLYIRLASVRVMGL